jgi:hypothetical protein
MIANLFCSNESPTSSSSNEGQQDFLNLSGKTKILPNTWDTLISDALKQLSLEDRDKVYHEIHGVADMIDEEPEFVAQCLNEMEEELVKLLKSEPNDKINKAFQLAESWDPNFVNNRTIRMRFLRAERFQAKRAAARMIRYFDWKHCLFGDSKLCKQITFGDLDDYDTKALKKGGCQVLPSRDRAGRIVIVFVFTKKRIFESPQSMVRQYIFLVVVSLTFERSLTWFCVLS